MRHDAWADAELRSRTLDRGRRATVSRAGRGSSRADQLAERERGRALSRTPHGNLFIR